MASSIATNQTQILSLINIPIFSDDLRLMISDYVYFRDGTQITQKGETCWIRLGPHLVDDKICLQILFYTKTESHVVASFGVYCVKEAISYYNDYVKTIKITKLLKSLNWLDVINRMMKEQYYIFYAFCPTDLSTIRISVPTENYQDISRVEFISSTETSTYEDSTMWLTIYSTDCEHKNAKNIIEYLDIYYKMASRHGMQSNEYATTKKLLIWNLANKETLSGSVGWPKGGSRRD